MTKTTTYACNLCGKELGPEYLLGFTFDERDDLIAVEALNADRHLCYLCMKIAASDRRPVSDTVR